MSENTSIARSGKEVDEATWRERSARDEYKQVRKFHRKLDQTDQRRVRGGLRRRYGGGRVVPA